MKKIFLLALLLWHTDVTAAEIDQKLLNEMLTTVNREYLEPVDNEKLIVTGIQAIHDLDPSLVFTKGSNQFYIYRNHQIYRIVPFPKDVSNLIEWINTLSQLIDISTETSDKVALKDFAVPDLVMQKMTTALDEYSHYYSAYEYNEEEEENAIYTLYSDRMIGKTLYLRIRIFNQQTAKQVEKSLKNHPDAEGVVLDLRGNSGGIFNEALKVAGLFTDNEIITYTAGRDNKNIHYYTSKPGTVFSGPMVIIVDGKTASAAEVLAGGLQEQSRAKVIGTRTFGKGTIQSVTTMSNGGKLVLTTEQFFTPSGKTIHQNGIVPNKCLTEEDGECKAEIRSLNDEDVELAVKLLKNEK
ncbi:MAG: hypothetical protein J6Y91_04260 [Alphaproteobacteria bacterium]|nr:hypothetical protein [Alphaproteobacteria bacterium]